MYPLIFGLRGAIIIQFFKIIIDSIVEKRVCIDHIFISWWFPSFHTGIASSVTMMAWMEYWFDSVIFALACGFALLVAYDAMNVRFESGKQAQCINEIKSDIVKVFMSDKATKKYSKALNLYDLKERLWHTPIEVLWWVIVSICITAPLYYYFMM